MDRVGSVYTAQLLLVDRGSPRHVYPKLIDLVAAFKAKGGDELILGRSHDCADIVLPTGEIPQEEPELSSTSRCHCKIRRTLSTDGSYTLTIEDCNSLNGTFHNWIKLGAGATPLLSDDFICFGGGSNLQCGDKLESLKLEDRPKGYHMPVSYRLSQSFTHGTEGKIQFGAVTEEQYSQVSVRSFSARMEQMQAEGDDVLAPCSANPAEGSLFVDDVPAGITTVPPTASLSTDSPLKATTPSPRQKPAAKSPVTPEAAPGSQPALSLRKGMLPPVHRPVRQPQTETTPLATPGSAGSQPRSGSPRKGKRKGRQLLKVTEEDCLFPSSSVQSHNKGEKARASSGDITAAVPSPSPAKPESVPSIPMESEEKPLLTPVEVYDFNIGLDRSELLSQSQKENGSQAVLQSSIKPNPITPKKGIKRGAAEALSEQGEQKKRSVVATEVAKAVKPTESKSPKTPNDRKRMSVDMDDAASPTPVTSEVAKKPAPKPQAKPSKRQRKTTTPAAKGLTGARAARALANGLPSFRSGFDIMCAEQLEVARNNQTTVRRPTLVRKWRDLDVAGKRDYENRAAAEKAEMLAAHPELALLNPNQEDEESRLLALDGGKSGQGGKFGREEGRARMRAARAKLFEDLDTSELQTRTALSEAERGGREPALEQRSDATGESGDASLGGDLYCIDNTNLTNLASRAAGAAQRQATEAAARFGTATTTPAATTALSERLLGTSASHTLVLPKNLAELLKRHQIKGVQFLWKNLVSLPSLTESGTTANGCIVAHGMGLGKTLTTITFTLMWEKVTKQKHTVVVAPKSTLRQWGKEFEDWCDASRQVCPAVHIVEGAKKHAHLVTTWGEDGGVLLLSYAMVVRLIGNKVGAASPSNANASPHSPKSRKDDDREEEREAEKVIRASQFIDEAEEAEQLEVEKAAKEKKDTPENIEMLQRISELLTTKTTLLVVDEGHKISSPNSALTRNLSQITTMNRVVLTGTPMQNSIKQYYAMLDFVRPDAWGYQELTDLYQRAANDPVARVELAHSMKGFIQRYDCSLLREELPPLTEYVIYVKPSNLQRQLYSEIMLSAGGDTTAKVKQSKALSLGSTFLKLCAHTNLAKEFCMAKGVKSLEEQIRTAVPAEEENDPFAISHDKREQLRKGKVLYSESGKDFSWALPLFRDDYIARVDKNQALRDNPKTEVLLNIIQQATAMGEKIAVFSESTAMLDVIETCLPLIDPPKARNSAKKGRRSRAPQLQWRRGTEYHRLDGSSTAAKRAAMCEDFNAAKSRSCLFLVSTRAGGLGINLVGATRVAIYGVGWNAQSDLQAIYRTYRYGQSKPVTVYRLVVQGTIEQTIFARTVAKLRMSMNFVDDKWSRTDLKSFDAVPPTDWSYHAARDEVLQSVHEELKGNIHSVLLHDSLKVALDAVEEDEDSDDSSEPVNIVIHDSDAEEGDEQGEEAGVSPELLGDVPMEPVNASVDTAGEGRAMSIDFANYTEEEGVEPLHLPGVSDLAQDVPQDVQMQGNDDESSAATQHFSFAHSSDSDSD